MSKKPNLNSLRTRITAFTIIAILVTIAAVFIVADTTLEDEIDRESVTMMNLIGENTGWSLEHYFDSIEKSVKMTAAVATDSLDSVVLVESGAAGSAMSGKKLTEEEQAEFDAYMASYCSGVEKTFNSVAGHTQGIVTYYYCINPEVSENVHGFFYSRVGKSGFRQEPPLDARELDPEDTEHTVWYYTPIKKARPVWVGPYTAHFLDEMWICSYLMPIYKAGQLIGVLGMDIKVDTLADRVRPIKVYRTGYAFLLSEDGKVIYHPNLELGSIPDPAGMSMDEDMMSEESSGDQLIRYTDPAGVSRQMSFCTLENGMKLVISAPSAEIDAAWTRLIRDILLLTLVIIIIAVLLLTPAVGRLIEPLQRLTAASRRLASADYDVELDYEGKDEVGVLTDSFRKMRDQIKLYIEDLNRRIITDDTTGLPNMNRFFSLAEEERKRVRKAGGSPALLFVNLTGMKNFNRQYGFVEGNKLLCAIADILADRYGIDRVGRLGRDNFAVITDEKGLEDELRELFADCGKANGGRTLPVRVGIYLDKLADVPVNVAVDRAKYASDLYRDLYMSGFYYFDESMLRQIENIRYVINNFDRALSEEWIEVYYQPVVSAADEKLCDEEALSRWKDPERGMLPPDEFIPALETAKLIYRLDLYVVDKVIDKIKKLQSMGTEVVPQSINLSRADFDSCDIVEEVCRRVDEAGISRDMINVEVTESIVGDDFEFMKREIARFRELGFRVWMDDFGSGFSTLEVLSEIRFDLIKIDMRYMQHLNDSRENRIMLTEMIGMAGALGLDTVCEGVETKEQVEFLKETGCTRLQGYYFGKPEPFRAD